MHQRRVNLVAPLKRLKQLILALALSLPVPAFAETFLLMAEEHGCIWCERWDDEIAQIYPKTDEGQKAPLVRYDLLDGTPDNVTLKRRVNFTPTFLLVWDGQEIGRIEGYPGEDFFWGLLGMLLDQADTTAKAAG